MLQDRPWLLIGRKMANEASPQELKELEEILRSNPELHFSLQALTELWHKTPSRNTAELESAYQNHLNRLKAELPDPPGSTEDLHEAALFSYPKRRFFGKNAIAASFFAVIILLVAGAVFYTVPAKEMIAEQQKPDEASVSTRYGSKTDIILPDGTKVWLNAGSKITYDKTFGESIRNVSLTGEAYFDVVHNAEKPFVIHTTAMDIRVLGTEFNVKSYPDEKTTEASLIRGSIEVTLKDKQAEKVILKPNQKIVVSNDQELAPATVDAPKKALQHSEPIFSLRHLNYFSLDSTIVETSWVQNRLVFEDESFEEIAIRMSRWYGVNFDFGNDSSKKLRFTGNIKNESVVDALKAMQITADFKFRILSDKHILITQN